MSTTLIESHTDRIDWQEDGSAIFTPRRALATSGGDLAQLHFRRPHLDDLIAREKASGDDLLKIALMCATLANVKLAELDMIDGGDMMVTAAIITKMLEYGETGSLLDRHEDRLTITDFDASLTLLQPIKTMQGEIDELVMRRPNLKEVRTNQGTTLAASVKLLAILTGHGPNVLGKLDALDGLILAELIADFLGKSRHPVTGSR